MAATAQDFRDRIRLVLCILSVPFLTLACLDQGSPEAPPAIVQAQLNEVLAIGLETHEEDYLGRPLQAATDRDGCIYVLEGMGPSIRVFKSTGEWAYEIRDRGQGPGEFDGIRNITITSDDRLIMFDDRNWRLSEFSSDGDFLDLYPLRRDGQQRVIPAQITDVAGSGYLIDGALRTGTGGEEPDMLLHYVRSLGESEIAQSFLSIGNDLGYTSSVMQNVVRYRSGSLLALGESEFVYAPGGYDGRLFHYYYDEHRAEWVHTDTWRGFVEEDDPGMEINTDDIESQRELEYIMVRHFTQEGIHGYLVHNLSLGLFELESGKIAHFTYILKDGSDQFGLELFDTDGDLLGYGTLPEVGRDEPQLFPIYVSWRDQQGRFYLTDPHNDIPAVRVVELEYAFADE